MFFIELFLVAIALSMDAFAVAICAGITMRKVTIQKALIIGLYFGVFQALMPLAGYILAAWLADRITVFDHWIALALLSFLGGKLILESCKHAGDTESPHEQSLNPLYMLPLALATSVDAMAVGVSYAFLQVRIVPVVLTIGFTTLIISIAGVKLGRVFGSRFKSKAELTGGLILVLIGLKIMLEHTVFLN